MQQSPWEANSHSASQEISRLLWNPKVHYHVHKSSPLVTLPIQMHPVHTFPPHFPKIHFNVIFPYTPRSDQDTGRREVPDNHLYENVQSLVLFLSVFPSGWTYFQFPDLPSPFKRLLK
jgi:hypothetical protein